MKFTKVIKADENFWSKENLKDILTHDLFEAIEHVINYGQHGAYKASLQDNILSKEDILSCLEEACTRFEEAADDEL